MIKIESYLKIASLIFVTLLLNLTICFAQTSKAGVYPQKGQLISKSNNTFGVGELSVTGYHLEQIKLIKPFDLNDGKPPLETAFRLIITTKKLLPTDYFAIWTDEIQRDAMQIKPNAVAIILYVRALPNGVKLALSRRGDKELSARSEISETLFVPSDYAISPAELETMQPVTRLRRLNLRRQLIQLRIENFSSLCSDVAYRNVPLVLEINGQDFGIECDGEIITHRFSVDEFAELQDGVEIALKFGIGRQSTNRQIIGRLNKSLIQ